MKNAQPDDYDRENDNRNLVLKFPPRSILKIFGSSLNVVSVLLPASPHLASSSLKDK